MNLLLSGGAKGADFHFGENAGRRRHGVVHYSFAGHNAFAKKHLHVLTPEQLLEADEALILANQTLKRRWPVRDPNTASLLRRNFWQVRETDSLYAVAHLQEDGQVSGGTAWAIEMFKNIQAKNAYLFDQKVGRWFWWNYLANGWIICDAYDVPRPEGRYTGIGSRDLLPIGQRAIEELYE